MKSDLHDLQQAIAELVAEYELLHCCEVTSIWIEHFTGPDRLREVTITTGPRVLAA